MGKVVELNELLNIISEVKNQNKTIITTNGCFDISKPLMKDGNLQEYVADNRNSYPKLMNLI